MWPWEAHSSVVYIVSRHWHCVVLYNIWHEDYIISFDIQKRLRVASTADHHAAQSELLFFSYQYLHIALHCHILFYCFRLALCSHHMLFHLQAMAILSSVHSYMCMYC